MVLLDFAENINVFPSKEDVKPETAGFAAFYWMENQCFPCKRSNGRASGRKVDTLEGLRKKQRNLAIFAAQGADQCGFCNPGYIVNIVALLRKIQIRQTKRSLNIYQAISAAVPDIRASCVRSATI